MEIQRDIYSGFNVIQLEMTEIELQKKFDIIELDASEIWISDIR